MICSGLYANEFVIPLTNYRNRRSYDGNSNNGQVGFSALGANRDAQLGQQGRIRFKNTLANFNQGWESRDSIFQCRIPGLYFFTMTARGRANYNSIPDRSRYYPNQDEIDRLACFEWR